MRRLLGRIGIPSAREKALAGQKRGLILPAYVAATRAGGRKCTVIVTHVQLIHKGFGTVLIKGKDRGKKWSWEARYRRDGLLAENDSEYQGPRSVFPGFTAACFRRDVQLAASAGVKSSKDLHDERFKERLKKALDEGSETISAGDRAWLDDLHNDLKNL